MAGNELKSQDFTGPASRNKAEADTSLQGQTSSWPNAPQRTKGCRCSDEHSGISSNGCLPGALTKAHLATDSLT